MISTIDAEDYGTTFVARRRRVNGTECSGAYGSKNCTAGTTEWQSCEMTLILLIRSRVLKGLLEVVSRLLDSDFEVITSHGRPVDNFSHGSSTKLGRK